MPDITLNPATWPVWAIVSLSVVCVVASGLVAAACGYALGMILLAC